MDNQFKVGDRVRYTGKSPIYNEPHLVGSIGTVRGFTNTGCVIVSGIGGGKYPENLELIEDRDTGNFAVITHFTPGYGLNQTFDTQKAAEDYARSKAEETGMPYYVVKALKVFKTKTEVLSEDL